MIRMLSEGGGPNLVFERLPWSVQPYAQLFFDDLLFRLELLAGKGRVAHSTGLDVERDSPPVRGKGEVVRGEVHPGECVIGSAVGQGLEINLAFCKAVGALEQHVLEEMRLSSLTELFIAGSNSIPDHGGDYRFVVELLCQDEIG